MTVGIVLGGGGARGAFTLGALRYLFGPAAVCPEVISGSSAGALIAASIAGATSVEEFRATLDDVNTRLLHINAPESFIAKQPWLEDLDGTVVGDRLDEIIAQRPKASRERFGDRVERSRVHPALMAAHAVSASAHLIARIPKLRRDLREHDTSILDNQPLRRYIAEFVESAFPPDHPVRLRITLCDLRTGSAHYLTEQGQVVGTDGRSPISPAGARVDIVDGVLASIALPGVYDPVRLAGRDYIDGGVRQFVPLEISIAAGATRTYTVLNIPLAARDDVRDWSGAHFLATFQRAQVEFTLHEIQIANLRPENLSGIENTTIAPTVRLVGRLDFNPDAGALAAEYGYIRAAEVLADSDDRQATESLTDALVTLRATQLGLPDDHPDRPTLDRLVGRALAQRAAVGDAALPDTTEDWPTQPGDVAPTDTEALDLSASVREALWRE